MEARFKVFDKKTQEMSEPFGFGDLYGYEGEANAVVLKHPYASEGQGISISSHRGGNPMYPQCEAWEGVNPDLVFLLCAGKDEHGKDVYVVIQDLEVARI